MQQQSQIPPSNRSVNHEQTDFRPTLKRVSDSVQMRIFESLSDNSQFASSQLHFPSDEYSYQLRANCLSITIYKPQLSGIKWSVDFSNIQSESHFRIFLNHRALTLLLFRDGILHRYHVKDIMMPNAYESFLESEVNCHAGDVFLGGGSQSRQKAVKDDIVYISTNVWKDFLPKGVQDEAYLIATQLNNFHVAKVTMAKNVAKTIKLISFDNDSMNNNGSKLSSMWSYLSSGMSLFGNRTTDPQFGSRRSTIRGNYMKDSVAVTKVYDEQSFKILLLDGFKLHTYLFNIPRIVSSQSAIEQKLLNSIDLSEKITVTENGVEKMLKQSSFEGYYGRMYSSFDLGSDELTLLLIIRNRFQQKQLICARIDLSSQKVFTDMNQTEISEVEEKSIQFVQVGDEQRQKVLMKYQLRNDSQISIKEIDLVSLKHIDFVACEGERCGEKSILTIDNIGRKAVVMLPLKIYEISLPNADSDNQHINNRDNHQNHYRELGQSEHFTQRKHQNQNYDMEQEDNRVIANRDIDEENILDGHELENDEKLEGVGLKDFDRIDEVIENKASEYLLTKLQQEIQKLQSRLQAISSKIEKTFQSKVVSQSAVHLKSSVSKIKPNDIYSFFKYILSAIFVEACVTCDEQFEIINSEEFRDLITDLKITDCCILMESIMQNHGADRFCEIGLQFYLRVQKNGVLNKKSHLQILKTCISNYFGEIFTDFFKAHPINNEHEKSQQKEDSAIDEEQKESVNGNKVSLFELSLPYIRYDKSVYRASYKYCCTDTGTSQGEISSRLYRKALQWANQDVLFMLYFEMQGIQLPQVEEFYRIHILSAKSQSKQRDFILTFMKNFITKIEDRQSAKLLSKSRKQLLPVLGVFKSHNEVIYEYLCEVKPSLAVLVGMKMKKQLDLTQHLESTVMKLKQPSNVKKILRYFEKESSYLGPLNQVFQELSINQIQLGQFIEKLQHGDFEKETVCKRSWENLKSSLNSNVEAEKLGKLEKKIKITAQ